MMKKQSLRSKLIRIFCITVIIPILVLSIYSYYNIARTLKRNTSELIDVNLKQIHDNLTIKLESYEDLLYQIYTDDSMNDWIDKINADEDISVTKNQMRRFIQSLLNSKEYIRSITVITASGTVITYDQLTSMTYQNSWLDNFSMTSTELYEDVTSDAKVHIYPTEYGTEFASKGYYLFHIAHRIVDYRNIEKKSGIVIISIDETFFQEICQTENDENYNFIVDENGRIITYGDSNQIGVEITNFDKSLNERTKDYTKFIQTMPEYNSQDTSIYVYEDEELGWDIINITDSTDLMNALKRQVLLIMLISFQLLFVAILLTNSMSKRLVQSVQSIVATMQKARKGDLTVCVAYDEKMPIEIETIAVEFNDMLNKLDCAIQKEKEAAEKEKQAQITALEAQINPHFLYNSLDTINWMAIDQEQYGISNAISTLATILSYSIVDSNAQVPVKKEVEWLRKYVFIQQFRLKNKFECKIDVQPEVMEYKIHKMLLQPFVENAIIHGFGSKQENPSLSVRIEVIDNQLSIQICDNGRGMDPDLIEQFNQEVIETTHSSRHLGMSNAITRLRMYYGKAGNVKIISELGVGTEIDIQIPRIRDNIL